METLRDTLVRLVDRLTFEAYGLQELGSKRGAQMFAIGPERPPAWPERLKPVGEGGFDKEPFEAWWERHRRELDHLPTELCEQWIYRHWKGSPFAFLPLDTLVCKAQLLPGSSIIKNVHREYGVQLDPGRDRNVFEAGPLGVPLPTAQAFMDRDTWDYPIVVLRTPSGFEGHASASKDIRWVLVEGHQRHRYLNALSFFGAAPEGPHRVLVISSPMVA